MSIKWTENDYIYIRKPWEDQIKVSNEVKTDIMSDKMTLPQH